MRGIQVLAGLAVTLALSSASLAAANANLVQVTEISDSAGSQPVTLPALTFTDAAPAGIPVIHVNSSSSFQRVNGFGAALTDSSAWLIHDRLGDRARAKLLDELFGPTGLDLQFLRLPIGASDFTVNGRPYSYDDLPPGQSDPQLRRFSIAHDQAYIIPTVRSALSIDPHLEIMATPWTPPTWMKSNHAFDDTAALGTLLPSAYGPLADYFVKFIRAYAAAGIRVSAVSPQNEPQGQSLFPGLHMPWQTEAMWIVRYLAPAFRAAGLGTKIYAADVGWSAASFQDALVRSPAARLIEGVAWHCYGSSPAVMGALHALAPQLDQVLSECATELTPYTVPEVIIQSLRNWTSTVALWNLALNPSGGPVEPPDSGCHGCRGLVTVNTRTHRVDYGLSYYQLGQFSRFIDRGARRISSNELPGLQDVAVINPDRSVSLVVYNQARSPATFAIAWNHQYATDSLAPRATATFSWGGS